MSAEPEAPRGHGLGGARLFAGLLLAFAIYLIYDATRIRQGGGFTVVGPAVFPLITAGALVGLALIMLLRVTRWPDSELATLGVEEAAQTHWPTVGIVLALLVVYPLAMSTLGYVLATAVFVPAGAWVLGSRKPWRDLAVGVGLALVIYISFTRFLDVRLPAGPLPF